MDNEVSVLNAIIQKCQKLIDTWEPKIEEAKKRMELARQAITMIEEESGLRQSPSKRMVQADQPVLAQARSSKYEGITLGDAITDILKDGVTADSGEIHRQLLENGFTSTSKDTKRDVYVKIYKMVKKNKVTVTTVDGIKRYTLKPHGMQTEIFGDRTAAA